MLKIKRLILTFILFCLCFCALVGCNKTFQESETSSPDSTSLSKAQKIEVISSDDGSVIQTLTSNEDIENFINNLKMETWDYVSPPANETEKQFEFIMYQEDTLKLGETKKKNPELHEMGKLIVYKDISNLTFELPLIKFTVILPEDVNHYLHHFKAE